MKKIILSFMVVIAIFSAASVFAESEQQTYDYKRLLKKGVSYGVDVYHLQHCMNGLGYNTGKPDGYFGKNTALGVRKFQIENGLYPDAIIGRRTGPKFVQACKNWLSEKNKKKTIDVIEVKKEEKEVEKESKKSNKKSYSINGYNEIGSNDDAAKVSFEFDIENDGDYDISLENGIESFIFEIDGVNYTGLELNSLAGYSLDIEIDGDEDLETDDYIIKDGKGVDVEVTVIVDAQKTVKGTGEYQIELEKINWQSTKNPNGILYLKFKSDDIDLIS